MSDSTQRQAGCSCGQLRAQVTGDPLRVSICHCYACQQRTGSAFSYQARFAADQVRISGESTEFVRSSDEGDEHRNFHFCPRCGATVWYTTAHSGGSIAIPVGAFADNEFPPPQVSVWEERRHAWVSVPDGTDRIA